MPLQLGPVRLFLYNAPSRKRAVPSHDMHHVLTGYSTSPSGEAEIAAWELGSGTGRFYFALLINLPALLYGVLLWPARTWRAFACGRRHTNYYQLPCTDAVLDGSVECARNAMRGSRRARSADVPVFVGWIAIALMLVVAPLGVLMVF